MTPAGERKRPPSGGAKDGRSERRKKSTAGSHSQPEHDSELNGPRAECIRILERIVGEAGVQHWLKGRQPALDDMTGAQLLTVDPERLLKRLRFLDPHGDDDLADPAIDHPPARRKDDELSRVLAILDDLDAKGGA
jgi:hypothetical protein